MNIDTHNIQSKKSLLQTFLDKVLRNTFGISSFNTEHPTFPKSIFQNLRFYIYETLEQFAYIQPDSSQK